MPATKTLTLGAAGIVAIGALVLGSQALLDDPDSEIGTIELGANQRTNQTPTQTSDTGTDRQVPALDELSGPVRLDDDADDLVVNGVELDFGPDRWVATADAADDFDGDGAVEALRDELAGLIDSEATFLVRFDDDGDDADIYVINELTHREVGVPAPWQSPDAASEDAVRQAAANAVGPDARVTDLDREDDGDTAWDAEVTDTDGREYDVRLDASGNVLDVRPD